MRLLLAGTAFSLLVVMAGVPAMAQTSESGATPAVQSDQPNAGAQQTSTPPVIALTEWNYDDIYANGWSLEKLLDEARVFGAEGEEIGDIENVLLSDKGKILAVIAEVGGFLDIGDTHVSVPWEQVEFSPALDYIKVPVNQDNVEEYSVFGEWGYLTMAETGTRQVVNDDLRTGPRVWKASELLDDYALLTGSMAYGYVDDLIFTNEGELHAVVVDSDLAYAGGPRAYPYYGFGYGWSPASPYYNLPYSADDIAVINTFDYDRLADSVTMTGSAEATDRPAGTEGSDQSAQQNSSSETTTN